MPTDPEVGTWAESAFPQTEDRNWGGGGTHGRSDWEAGLGRIASDATDVEYWSRFRTLMSFQSGPGPEVGAI